MGDKMKWETPPGDTFYKKCKDENKLETMGERDFNEAKKIISGWRSVIDVGAHIGETAYRYSKYFKIVYAFEPVYYDILKSNVGHIKNIKIYPYAATGKEEKRKMVRSKLNSGATVIKTDENNMDLKKSRFDQNEIEVNCIRLDHFNFSKMDFIKLDTEGFVLPVLVGMTNTIKNNNFPPLQIEFNHMTINMKSCIEYLNSLGYSKFSEFDVDHFYIKK
jgi:FkbM family methyltransferase